MRQTINDETIQQAWETYRSKLQSRPPGVHAVDCFLEGSAAAFALLDVVYYASPPATFPDTVQELRDRLISLGNDVTALHSDARPRDDGGS